MRAESETENSPEVARVITYDYDSLYRKTVKHELNSTYLGQTRGSAAVTTNFKIRCRRRDATPSLHLFQSENGEGRQPQIA